MAKKRKSYSVFLKVVVETEIEIPAESYEQALQKARELGVKDIVEFDTCFNDGSVSVTGILNGYEDNHK